MKRKEYSMKRYKIRFKIRRLPLDVSGDKVTPIIAIGFGYDIFIFQLLWFTLNIRRYDRRKTY